MAFGGSSVSPAPGHLTGSHSDMLVWERMTRWQTGTGRRGLAQGQGGAPTTCHEQGGEEVPPEGQLALPGSSDSWSLYHLIQAHSLPALVSGEATGKHPRVRTGKARAGATIFMEPKRLTPKSSVHTGWPWTKVFSGGGGGGREDMDEHTRGRSVVWRKGPSLGS